MASLIPGYEYDIFISYRQKDNKHDGWVTEFVDNLKGELESTFKEDVSVYFDINPHDGLLETHDVNASLKEKLKCLVFIPIISQTYCDSKSFAWQHELVAFNKIAKEDPFGRDIKLSGGNVASRILPVKIHDLDLEDKELLENELGGVLRCVEFIYKSAGVNRPLRANEDHPHDNLNKTYYRDQINKVANAVKDIIRTIKKHTQQDGEILEQTIKVKPARTKKLNLKIIIPSVLLILSIVLGFFINPKLLKPSDKTERSIAVLPFKLLSNEPDKQYLADGMMEAILLNLQKFKGLRVMPGTSVEQYRGTTKTTHIIAQELDVEYLLEGSFQKVGDNVRLIVKLIKAKKEGHAWANEYTRNWRDIFSVQTEVAQTVAKELYTVITPEEKQLTEKIPTSDITAYDLYLKANDNKNKYWATRDLSFYQKAVTFYKTAIEIDTSFAKAYVGLADIYFVRYYDEHFFKEKFLDSCLILLNVALSFDDQLDEAYFVKGQYYWANGQYDDALDNYNKAIKLNPNYLRAYAMKGYILGYIKGDYVKCIENFNKELTLVSRKERPELLSNLGWTYGQIGFIDKAKYYFDEKFALDHDKKEHQDKLIWIEYLSENFEELVRLCKKAMETDSTYIGELYEYVCATGHNDEMFTLAKKWIEYYKLTPSESGTESYVMTHWYGYAFFQAGKKKEAEYYFNQKIKYVEANIKLGRSTDNMTYYYLAETYAFLGDRDKAYQYLNEVNKSRLADLGILVGLRHDQMFAGIRNEERFQIILQNLEAKYQAEHESVRKWLEENNMF